MTPESLLSMSHRELLAAAQAQAKRIEELERHTNHELCAGSGVLVESGDPAIHETCWGCNGTGLYSIALFIRLRRALRWVAALRKERDAWKEHSVQVARTHNKLTADLAEAHARLATLRRAPVQRVGPNLAGESWVLVSGKAWDAAVGGRANAEKTSS